MRANALSEPLVLVVGLLDALRREFSLDPHRIYLAGQSDGGFAVWDLITENPERFAAAILVCGGGDPALAGRVAKIPIRVFRRDADGIIPVTGARQLVAAVTKVGGSPRYTEYRGVLRCGLPGLCHRLCDNPVSTLRVGTRRV